MFIASYTLKKLHDKILIANSLSIVVSHAYYESKRPLWFYSGAILGIMLTGILSDTVIKQRRILTVIITSLVMLVYDLVSIFTPEDLYKGESAGPLVAVLLALVTKSNEFAYLVFIPVVIAKKLGKKNDLNIPGTIFGVVIASAIVLD